EASWLMNTPRPPRRIHGFSSTVCRLETYCALMISSPSSRTQRRYGVSFSVANFLARSSETVGLWAIRSSLRPHFGATLVSGACASTAGRPRIRSEPYAFRHVRTGAARHGGLEGNQPLGAGRALAAPGRRDRSGVYARQGRADRRRPVGLRPDP